MTQKMARSENYLSLHALVLTVSEQVQYTTLGKLQYLNVCNNI